MFDLKKEAESVASDSSIDWNQLKESTLLITGATGLIGSACVRALLERNRACDANMRIKALVREPGKAAVALEGYDAADGLELVIGDIKTVGASECASDYIIHAACPTASRFFISHPVETIDTIVAGTSRLLSIAHELDVKSFVYVSSMEVYGEGRAEAGLDSLLDEHDSGSSDLMSVRSCYPEGKRMAEQYCVAYAKEYELPVKVARLSQTIGPGISKDDKRIFAMIARNVSEGEDVVLHTSGESTRMYVYIADAIRALLLLLTKGQPGHAYNIANPETYSSVRGMAEKIAAECAHSPMSVRLDIDPNAPFPPTHHLPLSVDAIAQLGWYPKVGLTDMYRNLMDYMLE